MPKVSIIGAGNVGATAALYFLKKQIAKQIILLDINHSLAKGKAEDLNDFRDISDAKIKGTNDYSEIRNSDVIIITAGKPREKNSETTREELFAVNSKTIKEIALQIKKYSPNSIVLTVTNPVDKMNGIIYSILGNRKKAIGVGSLLDTFRLKNQICEQTNAYHIDTMVIGPHNDKMIPLFSRTKIHDKPITEYCSAKELEEIAQKTRQRGKEIVDLMGSGYYAIAKAIQVMTNAIINNTNEEIPASVNLEGEYGINGISLGVPIRLGKNGAEVVEKEFEEKSQLLEAAERMK
ncbi:malate dehydrogenase [Candidatus Woesearchaeota archaeon]|nr:malate dehydrogenase [Candidatus Woesearchaeota archaeon]